MLAPGDARDNASGAARGHAGQTRPGADGATSAEVDADGKPIVNPYIPQFISKAPWYVGQEDSDEALSHQRQEENVALQYGLSSTATGGKWYDRGRRAGIAHTKYRKGACENCGAMTHKVRDCLERPRKRGAKWSGIDIQADELVTTLDLSWDGKRDLANGYDFSDHGQRLQERHDARLQAQALAGIAGGQTDTTQGKLTTQQKTGTDVGPQSIAEMMQAQSQAPMRLREDTATYLRPGQNHGQYNPKSRSMRKSDDGAQDQDDFVRGHKTDAEFAKDQTFAWEAKPVEPSTAAEGAGVEVAKVQDAETMERKRALAAKYGDVDVVAGSLPAHLLDADDSEDDDDNVKKRQKKDASMPVYDEDVYRNGHTTVFGSFYDVSTKRWGYRCCKTFGKNAYCTATSR